MYLGWKFVVLRLWGSERKGKRAEREWKKQGGGSL